MFGPGYVGEPGSYGLSAPLSHTMLPPSLPVLLPAYPGSPPPGPEDGTMAYAHPLTTTHRYATPLSSTFPPGMGDGGAPALRAAHGGWMGPPPPPPPRHATHGDRMGHSHTHIHDMEGHGGWLPMAGGPGGGFAPHPPLPPMMMTPWGMEGGGGHHMAPRTSCTSHGPPPPGTWYGGGHACGMDGYGMDAGMGSGGMDGMGGLPCSMLPHGASPRHAPYHGPSSKTRVCRYYLARSNNHFGRTCSYIHPCKGLLVDRVCKHGKRCTDDHVCVAHLLHGDTLPQGCPHGNNCPMLHVRHEADRRGLLDLMHEWLELRIAEQGAAATAASFMPASPSGVPTTPVASQAGVLSSAASGGLDAPPHVHTSLAHALPRVLCPFWYTDTQSGCKAGPDCIYEHRGQMQVASRPMPTTLQLKFAEKAWERRRQQDARRGVPSPPGALPLATEPTTGDGVFGVSTPLSTRSSAGAGGDHHLPGPRAHSGSDHSGLGFNPDSPTFEPHAAAARTRGGTASSASSLMLLGGGMGLPTGAWHPSPPATTAPTGMGSPTLSSASMSTSLSMHWAAGSRSQSTGDMAGLVSTPLTSFSSAVLPFNMSSSSLFVATAPHGVHELEEGDGVGGGGDPADVLDDVAGMLRQANFS